MAGSFKFSLGEVIGFIVGAPLLVGVVWLGVQSAQLSSQNPEEELAKGEVLFSTHCARCHGKAGIGENPKKQMGGMKDSAGYWAPALNGSAHSWHHSPEELFNTIKKGSLAQDSQMKGFEGKLTDQEIHQVLGYIKSLWSKEIQERYQQMQVNEP